MVPRANPKACWGVWDETGVTKAKSQPYVALPTVPGSLDASVHAALKYVLLLHGAEAKREEPTSEKCPQLHSRAKPEWPLLSSGQAGLGSGTNWSHQS